MCWAMISIAPATPSRTWVTSPAKATARFRPSDRVRSIAACLAAMIEAPAITHIAAMIKMPTAMISPVIVRARRRGSLVRGVNMLRFSGPDVSFEHSGVNNRLRRFSQRSSAAPLEGTGLDRIREGPALGTGAAVFALEPVVPLGLGVGVVDQGQRRVVAQTLLLAFHDCAVLPQEGAHVVPQNGPQRGQPGCGPIDAMVDLGHPRIDRCDCGQIG